MIHPRVYIPNPLHTKKQIHINTSHRSLAPPLPHFPSTKERKPLYPFADARGTSRMRASADLRPRPAGRRRPRDRSRMRGRGVRPAGLALHRGSDVPQLRRFSFTHARDADSVRYGRGVMRFEYRRTRARVMIEKI